MKLLLSCVLYLFYFCYRLFLSYYVPHVWPDEILFFSPSYELFTTGILRTTVMEGLIPGMETHTLWMPPLYMLLLCLWFYTGWVGIESARFLSALLGAGSILVLQIFLFPNAYKKKRKLLWSWIPGFILADTLFLLVSQTARMETLCAFMGIGAIAFAWNQRYVVSGFCIGLSFLAHPFGIFYSIPVVYLIFTKGKNILIDIFLKAFGGGIIPLFIWSLYVIPNWDLFILQFGAQLERKRELLENFRLSDKIRIFLFPYPFSYLKLFLTGIIPSLSLLSLNNPFLRSYISLYLVWFFAMVLGFYISSEAWYAIHILFPFYLLLFSVFLDTDFCLNTFKERFGMVRSWISILILIFCMYQIAAFFWYFMSHSYWENAKLKTDLFFEKVVAKAKPYEKIYLQLIPDPYFHLKKAYPNKQILEFIPGELPFTSHDLTEIWKTIDLYLFYNESLINPSLAKYLQDNPEYKKQEDKISYSTKVPGKGEWRIISYEKIQSVQK